MCEFQGRCPGRAGKAGVEVEGVGTDGVGALEGLVPKAYLFQRM